MPQKPDCTYTDEVWYDAWRCAHKTQPVNGVSLISPAYRLSFFLVVRNIISPLLLTIPSELRMRYGYPRYMQIPTVKDSTVHSSPPPLNRQFLNERPVVQYSEPKETKSFWQHCMHETLAIFTVEGIQMAQVVPMLISLNTQESRGSRGRNYANRFCQ